jgi:hypothetical protein
MIVWVIRFCSALGIACGMVAGAIMGLCLLQVMRPEMSYLAVYFALTCAALFTIGIICENRNEKP